MYRYYIKDHGRRRLVEYPIKEAMQLSELIGFDFERETQYRWFLNQALNTLLPMGWKRESDPFGNVHFHNAKTQVTTKNNPLVYKFRKCFERLLLKEMEQPNDTEKNPETKSGKSQLIAISSYEEQETIFKSLMEKGALNELNFSEKFLELVKEAEEFYEAIFVDESFKPPKSISESIEYQLVNPEEMADIARDYKIILEPQLMWIARVALVLPLPPLWRTEINALGEKVYINAEINNPQTEAPFHNFLNKYIQRARLVVSLDGEKFMTFYDKDCVKYVVDLVKLPSKKDYKVLKEDKPEPEMMKKALYFKPQLSSDEALTDVMIFEIAQSVGIDMTKELHLISAVYQIIETIKSKNILKNWDFRITMEGNKYWYNTKDKRSIPDFPYKDEIKKYVRVVRKEAISNAKGSIKTFSERHPEFQAYGKEFYERCKKEAILVTESLIKKHLSISEPFPASGLVKAHLKHKDNIEEYLDLVFANPFNFGFENLAGSIDPSHLSIDMPAEFLPLESRKLQQLTESELESRILEKQEAESKSESQFVRNDRDRRKTITIESIPSESPTKPDFRRFKTIGREDDGVIAEIDSSEEDSKSERLEQDESEDDGEYDELQQLVEEKIEQPKLVTKISSLRMAASRKNTIESIMFKERRLSSNENLNRSSSDVSALQSEESPDYRDMPAKSFGKAETQFYGDEEGENNGKKKKLSKNESKGQSKKFSARELSKAPNELKEYKEHKEHKEHKEPKEHREHKESYDRNEPKEHHYPKDQKGRSNSTKTKALNPAKSRNSAEPENFRHFSPSDQQNPLRPDQQLRAPALAGAHDLGDNQSDSRSQNRSINKTPSAASEPDQANHHYDRKVSLISGREENARKAEEHARKFEVKKSIRFKDESLSDQMDFSSIASKSDQQSIFEDELAEIEIDKKNEDRFKLESESSSVSHSIRKKFVSQKSLKSVILFDDDGIKINPKLAAEDPVVTDELRGKLALSPESVPPEGVRRTPLYSETLKLPKMAQELVRKSTSPEALNKFDWVAANMHRGIIYETSRAVQTGKASQEGREVLASPRRTLPADGATRPVVHGIHGIMKRNTQVVDSSRLGSSALGQEVEKGAGLAEDRRKETLKILERQAEDSYFSESGRVEDKEDKEDNRDFPYVVSDQVLLDNFETQKKIFDEVFNPLGKKPLAKSPILLPKIVNLDVFGAHVMRLPRVSNDPNGNEAEVVVSPKHRKLGPIDEKAAQEDLHGKAAKLKLDSLSPQELVISSKLRVSKLDSMSKTQSLPQLRPAASGQKLKQIKEESLAVQEKLLFMYYLELIGHPNCPRSSLNFFYVQRHIQPPEVMSMARRLGLRVSSHPYSSYDSDLVWVAYLQIATPMPAGFNSHTRVSTMLEWPLGKHPGDVYFTLLCKCQKKIRNNDLKKLGKQQKVENLIAFSWGRFLNEKNKPFFYNFLTCNQILIPPQVSENYDVSIGVRKKNKLKDILSLDDDIQEIISKYDIAHKYKDDKFYNLSNYIIQTLISNESVDEDLKLSEQFLVL